jgi:hypothetical protein
MSRKKIYTSDSRIQIMDAKHLLDETGINYFEINKMDSSYAGAFGNIELHVEETDAEKAIKVLADLK